MIDNEQIRLLLIYALAHGMDPATQSTLLNASSLGMEYHSILMNCTMLGFTFQQVFYQEEFHPQPFPQRLEKKEYLRQVRERKK